MEHVDLWYEIASAHYSLVVIFEDDVIFVPFFKEKFNCLMHDALKIADLTAEQDHQSMFVFGGCLEFHSTAFESKHSGAIPVISLQRKNASRCSHAYALSSNTAKMLVNEIKRLKNVFTGSDIFLRKVFARSSSLDSLWFDPPLAYQGNQIQSLTDFSTLINKSYW